MAARRKWRSALWILAAATALTLLTGSIWICIALANRPGYTMPETEDWHTGDIFFSVGDSWESVAVRSLSGAKELAIADSTPSHCGFVVVNPTTGPLLIHESTSARHIVAETPEEYLKNNGAYCLYALKAPCSIDTLRLCADIDSLMRLNMPFDFNFDHSDHSALYCTEMVLQLLESNGCSCASHLRRRNFIYPQDLADLCKTGPKQ